MELSKAFGLVIRELRKECGLTQEELGLEADLRRTYVSILELGQQMPSLQTIFKISSALKVSPSKVVDLVEEKIYSSEN